MRTTWIGAMSLLAVCALAACGGSSSEPGTGGSGGSSGSGGGDAQTPPQGMAAVEAWLAKGFYKSWKCEAAPHAARPPSIHSFNRICSNDLVSSNATGTGAWPKGAAAVKELYDSATGTTPIGYAVYLKTESDSAAGAAWYWYERVPTSSTAPHDAHGVVADGLGSSGPASTICVSCHVAAGTDALHTPSPGGRDFVYTPVH